jgi:hypothetical protein
LKIHLGSLEVKEGLLNKRKQDVTVSMVTRTQDLVQLSRPGPASQKVLTGVFSVDLYSTADRKQISVQGLTKERSMWFSFENQHQLNKKCPWKGAGGNCLIAGLKCKHWNTTAEGSVGTPAVICFFLPSFLFARGLSDSPSIMHDGTT